MRITSTILPAFALFAMLTAGPVHAQTTDEPTHAQQLGHWFNEAARAYHREDTRGWVAATEQLHRMRPYNQDLMTHLVRGYARLGELSKAFDMMLRMQQQGLAEDWDSIEDVAPLRQHRLYEHLNSLMSEAGQPFGETEVWGRIEGRRAMPEALALDADGKRLFVGTVRDGEILVSNDGEQWERFASPDDLPELQSVFDLLIDAERGHLWVATGRVPQFHGARREDGVRSSLLRLNLGSGELEKEFPLSSGSGRNLLGSLVQASDGTLFAADTQSPIIYRLTPDGEALEPYFGHQNFSSLRGLALSGDGRLLYVADYELGIFVIDAKGGRQAWKLAVPDTLNEGGIDGLYWWDDHLIAIQNAVSPQRILRLGLGEDGLGVVAVAPIAAAKPEFDAPTFGVMDGQILYFLAGSHWQHVDGQGLSSEPLPDVAVMKLDVDAASVQVVGQEMLEQLQRQ